MWASLAKDGVPVSAEVCPAPELRDDPRIERALDQVRVLIDELGTVPDADSIFDVQRGLLMALQGLHRIRHGIARPR